jgi:hypothetical protein
MARDYRMVVWLCGCVVVWLCGCWVGGMDGYRRRGRGRYRFRYGYVVATR